MPSARRHFPGRARRVRLARLGFACVFGFLAIFLPARSESGRASRVRYGPVRAPEQTPIAGAFVYPVGEELDFTKSHRGESAGFYISDSYLVRRGSKGQRVHLGVDFSCGRGGSTVRAVASGVVVVADANALIKVRKAVRVKVARTSTSARGKRASRTVTRYRTVTKWRTGWGNYVVIRHLLPNGQTVHSLYGHLKPKSVLVERGDIVAAGQPIALVGNTGRASSPHLHLEIRKSLPAELAEDGLDPEDVEDATVEDRSFALLQTVDPISFLEQHVRHFDDLENDSWQAAYALAACRDGVLAGDGDEFDPNESITRADFYRALAAVFRPGMGASRPSFAAAHRSLAQAGIVDTLSAGTGRAGDTLTRSEALELLLRCLDKSPARGRSLAAFERDGLCRDFNRVFAGPEAAARAERQARATAAARTRSERKAADMEFEKALLAAKAKGAGATVRKRVKRRVVKPIEPVLGVEEGFAALAQSKRNLTRAEACLLLASAFRPGGDRASALEQAAARVPSPTSG